MHGPGTVREAQFTQKEDIAFKPRLLNKSWRLKRQEQRRCTTGKGPFSHQPSPRSTSQSAMWDRAWHKVAQVRMNSRHNNPGTRRNVDRERPLLAWPWGGSRFATLAGFDDQFR